MRLKTCEHNLGLHNVLSFALQLDQLLFDSAQLLQIDGGDILWQHLTDIGHPLCDCEQLSIQPACITGITG